MYHQPERICIPISNQTKHGLGMAQKLPNYQVYLLEYVHRTTIACMLSINKTAIAQLGQRHVEHLFQAFYQ